MEPTRKFEIELTKGQHKLMVEKAHLVYSNAEIRESGIDQIVEDFIMDAIRDDLLGWFPNSPELKP